LLSETITKPAGSVKADPRAGMTIADVGWSRQSGGMCGRARLSSDVSEIKLVFSIPPERPAPNFSASWNVAPTDSLPIVRYDGRAGERSLDLMRWGLVPYWAKDPKVGFSNINARAEGIDARPAYREAFQRRRCLVPLDSFYEWQKRGKEQQPYAVALADRRLMAMAGLWESWRSPGGERLRSFAIVTTSANDLLAPVHDRMPVILDPHSWPLWLNEEPADPEQLKALLVPYPADDMAIWPVDRRVGNVKNNDPALVEPVASAG
jgi:putative SOS response-associated peptidase YedK